MKELRVQHHGLPVRAFFAFDPLRKAIVLCAGNKDGMNEKRFYKEMIILADNDPQLSTLKRYIAALGGELSINVTLPTGKKVSFNL